MNFLSLIKKAKVRITLRIWPGEKGLGKPMDRTKKVTKEEVLRDLIKKVKE